MNADHTETLLGDAMRAHPVVPLDLDRLAGDAVHTGTRTRRRRQGVVVLASLAVAGVASLALVLPSGDGGDAAPFAGPGPATPTVAPSDDLTQADVTATPTAPASDAPTRGPDATSTPTEDGGVAGVPSAGDAPTGPSASGTAEAYAVLDVPGWSTDMSGAIDEKLYYVGPGGKAAALNWRPADSYGDKYVPAGAPLTAEIDGDPAHVVTEDGTTTVVGPVRDGRFLTLQGIDLTEAEVVELARSVHRQ